MAKAKGKNEIFEWIKALAIAIVLAAIIRYFLFAPILVDGLSMMPTLHNENRMVVNKLAYKIGDIDRFDIVVFHATEEKDYIKRVIGLPGDKIEYKDDTLYINGKAYEEPYLDEAKEQVIGGPLTEPFTLEEIIGQETVPEGEVFVMGDNRNHSSDSRDPSVGILTREDLIGRAWVRIWPLDSIGVIPHE